MHDLQPDVSAPGETILAAYPHNVPPTKGGADHMSVKFNVVSGTSMSCPHVAGAAAYVKTFHPGWSPSAIKSALMTTGTLSPFFFFFFFLTITFIFNPYIGLDLDGPKGRNSVGNSWLLKEIEK